MSTPTAPPTTASRLHCPRPVFIVGTERSGSNLLRLVLNSHSQLAIPHPPHVMNLMHTLERAYANLGDVSRFGRLADDVAELITRHTNPWPFAVTGPGLVEQAPERSLFGLYAASQELYRAHEGKPRWGCKSTFMIHHVEAILRVYPEAQLLLLVRDPRDVAVSAAKSVFNHFHPWFVAGLWAREQAVGLRWLENLPGTQIRLVHYETLLADPEGEVRRICAFLGEPFEEAMLRFFETDDARQSASLCADWQNTDSGFLRHNTRKYLKSLSRCDIAVIEDVAQAQMTALGYELETSQLERAPFSDPPWWRRLEYWLREKWQKAQVEHASYRRDRNYPLRVRKTAFLRLLQLKARLGLLG